MTSARRLLDRLGEPGYRQESAKFAEKLQAVRDDDEALLDIRLLPDPTRARVRVYATQSTQRR